MTLVPLITKTVESIAVTSPLFCKIHRRYYKKWVSREIDMAEISSSDNVLCVGGGPLPCTALEIAMQTRASVQVIDSDLKAVKRARKVIGKFNLTDKVKITLADGKSINPSDFSVIHIASQAYPRTIIFKNIWLNAPLKARILLRLKQRELDEFIKTLPQGCRPDEFEVFHKESMKATVLFSKRQEMQSEKAGTVYRWTAGSNRIALVGRPI